MRPKKYTITEIIRLSKHTYNRCVPPMSLNKKHLPGARVLSKCSQKFISRLIIAVEGYGVYWGVFVELHLTQDPVLGLCVRGFCQIIGLTVTQCTFLSNKMWSARGQRLENCLTDGC